MLTNDPSKLGFVLNVEVKQYPLREMIGTHSRDSTPSP